MSGIIDYISTTHVVVVTNEVVPNLSPVLDSRFDVHTVVLLHTDSMRHQADFLAMVYKKHGVESEFVEITDIFDYVLLKEQFESIFTELSSKLNSELSVNISLGTKPITMALMDVARAQSQTVYYLHKNDHLSLLNPVLPDKLDLEDNIKVADFMLANGLMVSSINNAKASRSAHNFFNLFMAELPRFLKVIPVLNGLATSADNNDLVSEPIGKESKKLMALVAMFEKLGFVKVKNNRLVFKNELERFFVNGGWLEVFIHMHLTKLQNELPKLQDVAMGVEVENKLTGMMNEIDNVCIYNNTLYCFECKTSVLKGRSKTANEIIYKLETLIDEMGGSLTKGVIVSLFPMNKVNLERANQYGLGVLVISETRDIRGFLRKWLTQQRERE